VPSTDEIQAARGIRSGQANDGGPPDAAHSDLRCAPGTRRFFSPRRRVLAIAVLGEGVLALAGMVWAWTSSYPIDTGPWGRSLVLGVATASALAAMQYWMLRAAPERGLVKGMRRLYRDLLKPLFSELSFGEIVLISLLAGLGEELLFRGAMQPAWGWVPASLLFGLCHVGGRATWLLGVWAAAVGLLLGWLAILTHGLLAPIVAHALYDAVALSYIRWGRDI
jgi:membrane protease YdiL (CAAX protease family)